MCFSRPPSSVVDQQGKTRAKCIAGNERERERERERVGEREKLHGGQSEWLLP